MQNARGVGLLRLPRRTSAHNTPVNGTSLSLSVPPAESLVSIRKTAERVKISGCRSQGMGIRIVGGRDMTLPDGRHSHFGIFVKEVLPGRLADRDGVCERLCVCVCRPAV